MKLAGPDYGWPWVNLAGLLLTRGENDRAFAAAVEAVKRDPPIARGFYTGGKALINLGKPDLALKWLERAAALDPANPDPLYLLARAYDRSGRKDEARDALRRFQELRAKTPSKRR
jgi:Flp pilus assembly protein TadD